MCNAVVVREVLQRIWEPWRWVKWPAIGSWPWPVESSIKLIFLKLHKQLLKNSSTILWSFSIWSKLEKWKSLISGCHISWLKIKKTVILTCCLLLFCATTVDHFSIGLWHAWKVDCMWQPVMTKSVAGLRRSSKVLPKAKLVLKKCHGYCLVVCCWSDPLQLSESGETITSEKYAQQIDEMHRKLPCLQPALVNRKGPILFHDHASHNECFKSWTNWARKFCLIHHIHLTSHQPPLLQASWQLFAGKMLPQPAGWRLCFPRVQWSLKHRFLHYRNTQTYFSWAKSVLIAMVPFWLIKMCLSLAILI